MTQQEIDKKYRTAVRKKQPRSGATWQRVKEEKIAPTDSAYWDHVHANAAPTEDNEYKEVVAANADGLGFSEKGDIQTMTRNAEYTQELTVRARKLLDLAKQILTTQQYNVFVMLAVKEPHLTERETAKVLSVTPGRVHQLWVKAQTKLQKAYEERT